MRPENGVPLSPFTGVPGWETDAEEEVLRSLAKAVPSGGWIVELGAEFGRSAATFCEMALPDVNIASVDLFPEDHPQVGRLVDAYKWNLTEAGFAKRTLAIKLDSAQAGIEWGLKGSGEIDLLFIDADHTYDGVMRDTNAWEAHVKVGGHIAFHDCAYGDDPHVLHLEVSRFVDKWFNGRRWSFLGQVDSLRVYRRLR